MSRILVVDDESVDRELAQRCLRGVDGLEVLLASNGREALEAVAREQPDLVLTDLRMPRMNGVELVEQMVAEHPLIPVMLMTSQGNERIAVQALQAGAASYVPKSDLDEMLSDTVEQLLQVAEARRSRAKVLQFLSRFETHFELVNDLELITAVVAYIEDNLARLGFASKSVRTQIGMALMEAIANAMLHGNLEVGSELRRTDRDAFDALVEERRSNEPYASRRVRCEAKESREHVEYTIADEGPGFDSSNLPDPTDAANLLVVGGRGIMLMKTFMDEVRFSDNGACVTLVKGATGS